MFDKDDWLNAMRAIKERTADRFDLKSPQICVFGWCICAEHQREFRSVVLRADPKTPQTRPGRPPGARNCLSCDQRKGWKYRVDLAPSGLVSFVRELG